MDRSRRPGAPRGESPAPDDERETRRVRRSTSPGAALDTPGDQAAQPPASSRLALRRSITPEDSDALPVQPPASSRLTVRPRRNRRRRVSLWTRLPRPAAVADACGRAVRRSMSGLAAACAVIAAAGTVWLGY